jgi:hypothetical protein
MNVAISTDKNVIKKENEKKLKYENQSIEIQQEEKYQVKETAIRDDNDDISPNKLCS